MTFYIEITSQDEFDAVTSKSGVCVVDFYAKWCGPCKKLSPELQAAVENNSVLNTLLSSDISNVDGLLTFVKVNSGDADNEELIDIATDAKVKALPTIIFYKNGELQTTRVEGSNLTKILNVTNSLIDELTKN
jgi:thioredoxin 1